MKRVKMVSTLFSMSVLFLSLSCDGSGGPEIDTVSAAKSTLKPEESVILHCYLIDDPEVGELTYAWSVEEDLGTFEFMGDSALWTAPDFLWDSRTVRITVTVGDTEGNTDEESIDLEVKVTRSDVDASDDTYTNSVDPDDNFVNSTSLLVGYDESSYSFWRSYFKFPTPALQAGDSIRGARIRLYREHGEGEDCEMSIYLPRTDWQGSGVTWNDEPDADEFALITDTTTDAGYFYINLTSLVGDWIDASQANYGIMLRALDETDSTHSFREFKSREGAEAERPVLEVVSW